MKDQTLFRLAGVAAVLGGAIRIATSFVPWDGSAMIEAVAFAVDVFLLFGLIGIYLAQRAALGWFGFAAFVLAETGIASIVGPDTQAFGIDTYQAGVAAISIGLALLSAAMLTKRIDVTAAVSWIASLIVGAGAGFVGQAAMGFHIGGILFGLGFVAAGISLLMPAAKPT